MDTKSAGSKSTHDTIEDDSNTRGWRPYYDNDEDCDSQLWEAAMAYNRQVLGSDPLKARLQALFDMTLLDNGYITKFDFDLFDHELSIKVRVPLSEDEILTHRIVFSGVRALLNQNELLFPLTDVPVDAVLVNGVGWTWAGYNYYDRPVIVRVIDPPHGLEKVAGVSMNFVLDITASNGVLLIAARGVSIDGEYFDVGLPPAP